MTTLLVFVAFGVLGFGLIRFASYDPLSKFKQEFNLEKAGLEYSKDIDSLASIVFAERSSSLKKSEGTIWVNNDGPFPVFLSATKVSKDLRIAMFAKEADDLHFVLDSKDNNGFAISNLRKIGKLPERNYELEGHFQDKFDVYCGADQERELLEILTPDVMLDVFDNLNSFDLEIINGQVAMNIENAAKDRSAFSNALKAFNKCRKLIESTSRS